MRFQSADFQHLRWNAGKVLVNSDRPGPDKIKNRIIRTRCARLLLMQYANTVQLRDGQ